MIEDKFVRLNGYNVRYEAFGEGQDVIFLHGWGGELSAFLYVARQLDGGRRHLMDLVGFGESDAPREGRGVQDYASDVVAYMDAFGVKEATIVGHSFGGRIGLQLAASRPDLVKKLVLVDSAGLKPRRGLKYYVKVGAHKLLRAMGFSGLKGSEDYRALSAPMKETFKNAVNYDETPLLKKISCPTAIFWGDEDEETPFYMAKKLKAGISDSEIFLLRGGHFAYMDDFHAFMRIFEAFLSG